MIFDTNVGPDDVARAIATIAEAGRESLDWAALARAVADHRRERVERRRDRQVLSEWEGKVEEDDVLSIPVEDAETLSIKVNSILLGSVVRFGQSWQRLVEQHAPELRGWLEQYQHHDDPSPEARDHVIWQLRTLFHDMGLLMRDHAAQFDHDLRRIQNELLPYEK